MGIRFGKSSKISKGTKVNVSKSGTRARSTTNARTTTSHKPKQTVNIPTRIKMEMNDKGAIRIFDVDGYEITDSTVLRRIRATDRYHDMKKQLEMQRREKIDAIVRDSEEENDQYLTIHQCSAFVESEDYYLEVLEDLQPEEYTVEEYQVPMPTEEEVRALLTIEARENVKAFFLIAERKRRQYVEERIGDRLNETIHDWKLKKAAHDEEQNRIKMQTDAELMIEYGAKQHFLQGLIEGDEDIVADEFDEWIASCELPVEMNIDYDWNKETGVMMLDVDLPEIEDLPTARMVKNAAGNLQEKSKTQKELRGEYAELVFGLAIFLASHCFNTSPAIKKILISGYTQRRDRIGEISDDYIYSIKFYRDLFENRDLSMVDPREFCMIFENRCNMTTTAMFKVIVPYEVF